MNQHNAKTQSQLISPFEGEPITVAMKSGDGVPQYFVTVIELTPLRLKFAEFFSGLFIFVTAALCFFALSVSGIESGKTWLASIIGVSVLCILICPDFEHLLRKKTQLIFSPTTLTLMSSDGPRTFDRTITHRFVMRAHDRAREEAEKIDLDVRRAAQNGRIISPKRYYADSFHIIFEYLGHRHDIATIYDKNRALAVIARLKACDEVMNNQAQMGDGEALEPEQQWGDQPGDLPNE